jgi:hypothetical protein
MRGALPARLLAPETKTKGEYRNMKNRLFAGGAAIIAGALFAAGPRTIFKICDQGHHAGHSVCYWTSQTALAAGITLALAGVAYMFFADPRVRAGLSLAAAGDALIVLLTANVFIGVDPDPMMACRIATLPALNVVGSLTIILAATNAAALLRGARGGNGGGAADGAPQIDAVSPLA